MKNYKFGYARVSTEEQVLDRQIDMLSEYGVNQIYSEKMTGTKRNRPELEKMLDRLSEGDTVVIESLSRLGRSTKDLIETDKDFLDNATRKTVRAMKNGAVSGLIETKEAYYVIKMVNNNDPAAYNKQCETVISQEEDTQFDAVYKNTIKAEYTATAQSYWKGRVTIGYLTTDSSTQQ